MMNESFIKVDRRGRLLQRNLTVDPEKQVLRYKRNGKKFAFKRKSSYQIASIVDVRSNWDSQKFKKTEEKERKKWLEGRMNNESRIKEECSFSIHFQNGKSIDLIATSPSLRDKWVRSLRCCMFEEKNDRRSRATRSFMQKCFKEADTDCDNCINFVQALSILNKLNLIVNPNTAREVFEKSKILTKMKDSEQVIDFDEFIIFFDSLIRRADIETIFKAYAKDRDMMGPEELQKFLFNEQYTSIELSECEKLIEKYQSLWLAQNLMDTSIKSDDYLILERYMNIKGFEAMLLSDDFNLFDSQKLSLHHDMKKPLNHYYIKSSHNTYLQAGQLVGDSSIEGYIEALRRGYRCIELDIWDGDEDDGPIVYHGYTLVTKLLLRHVLDTIVEHAFDSTPYPLILSLDVNCSEDQQKTAAALLVAILGNKLYKRPVYPGERELPSPEQLKGKILVKAKVQSAELSFRSNSSSSVSSVEEDMNETRRYIAGRRYSHAPAITPTTNLPNLARRATRPHLIANLGELAVYCRARKFHSLKDTMTWNFNEMFSVNESESERLARFETGDYIQCTAKRLCRIYPKGSRVDSSNYDPIPHWNVGCQMVALNVQTPGKYLMLNESKFKENNSCGYLLKPDLLMSDNMDELHERKGVKLKTIEITIISGHRMPKNGAEELVDPYVLVKVFGHEKDKQKFKTSVVRNNGFNPEWNQTFVLNVQYPELAYLFFIVKDENKTGKNNKLASNVIPFSLVGQGYRHLQLLDNQGRVIDGCRLFMRVRLYHS